MKKFNIHPSFVILIVLSFLLGLIKDMILILICFLIHELGHLLFILLFKYKVNKFSLYPYGGVLFYSEKNDFLYKEFLISFGGILMNFIFYLLFSLLKIHSLVVLNLYFIILNILPIIPFDGGKLLFLMLSVFLPSKLSKIIAYSFSLLLLLLIIVFIRFDGYFYYFIVALILKENILGLIYLNKSYHKFTLMKYLYPNLKLKEKQTKRWVNNPIENLFKGRNMVFDYETFKVGEGEVLNKFYKK